MAGQPLGYKSSWPLFAQKMIVWWCAEQVYPGRTFRKYAVLVIADAKVAQVYEDRQESRSRKRKIGSREFAGEGSL